MRHEIGTRSSNVNSGTRACSLISHTFLFLLFIIAQSIHIPTTLAAPLNSATPSTNKSTQKNSEPRSAKKGKEASAQNLSATTGKETAPAATHGGKQPFELFNQRQQKAPTYISAERLTVDNAQRNFEYDGGVEVIQADMLLVADKLNGTYGENRQIQTMTALGNVMITKGETIRASGNRAEYNATTGTLILTESPELQQNGSILSADRVKVFIQENRSQAEGNVRVKMAK